MGKRVLKWWTASSVMILFWTKKKRIRRLWLIRFAQACKTKLLNRISYIYEEMKWEIYSVVFFSWKRLNLVYYNTWDDGASLVYRFRAAQLLLGRVQYGFDVSGSFAPRPQRRCPKILPLISANSWRDSRVRYTRENTKL